MGHIFFRGLCGAHVGGQEEEAASGARIGGAARAKGAVNMTALSSCFNEILLFLYTTRLRPRPLVLRIIISL